MQVDGCFYFFLIVKYSVPTQILAPHLHPSLLRESGQQSRWRLFFSDESRLQVVYGVALVLPNSQTQPADQLPIPDAVHVQRLPVVLRTGGGSWVTVPLVLREQMSEQTHKTDENELKQQGNSQEEDFRLTGSQRINVSDEHK